MNTAGRANQPCRSTLDVTRRAFGAESSSSMRMEEGPASGSAIEPLS
jgi:hypothetical protein